jgi:excisionase family DNA binding protein
MPDVKESSRILTITEVARELGCSKTHVSKMLNGKVSGVPKLNHVALGRRKLVRSEWLIEWIESNRVRC